MASVPAVASGNFFFPSPWAGLGLLFLCLVFAGDLVAWRSVQGERTRVTGTAHGRGGFNGCGVEMFLDRTDLSKTVDRHGTERCHVLPRSSRFLAGVLVA